ncbi:WD40/YVTN/BNR-like repeat-containing protein [Leifsonia poae]|uniref:Glycosyl hydrolase n=1 Tax=Leifsonia poae TaxID=110933 RepID=A0A9W6HDV9_9MICO|nr:exo-alpha-sialidase [Leifsonia poae]GLJ78265.1 hypothetical protein GCM10017584_38390 [Leifsonia poae]
MHGPEGTTTAAATTTAAKPPRPPGGKALLRLIETLAKAGLDDVARQTVADAVSERAPAVLALAPELNAAPAPRSTRGRGRARTPAPEAAEPGATAAEAARAYAEDSAAAALLLGPPTRTGPQWRPLGPATITNGQTYGASRINVSGRASALAVDPARPDHVLVGAANGGVWETSNGGDSWAPRTDYAATTTVGALAFDPSNPSLVYCGTGEGDWWSWLGNGVLRSTDGGTNWTPLATNPFVGQGFHSLVVDPSTPTRLFAGTTGGLYISTDSGVTWTQSRFQRTWSISVSPTGGELLAGCADGAFSSTDSGATWNPITLPGAPASYQRVAVSIAPSSPTVAYVWAADNASPSAAYLWRRARSPRAVRWTQFPAPPGSSGGQGWYDWYVAASPDSATEVYCGEIHLHRGDLTGSTFAWENISSKPAGDSIHPDQHSIAFSPRSAATLYAGSDGGVFRSDDRGVTWRHRNNGLAISEYEYLAHDIGSPRWLIGGTQDNGTNRYTGSATWEHVQDGDGGDCASNRTNSDIVFHTFQNGSAERSTTKGAWASWSNITPARPAGESSGLFYVPFEASESGGDTVALGGDALYVSRDNGTTWTRVGYPAGGTASAMHVPDPDTVVVGLTGGGLLVTRFSGGAWGAFSSLTTPRAGAWVSDIRAVPGGSGRLWATSSSRGGGRVFRSSDGGTTWTDCSAGLPNLGINAIAVDPANPSRVWVAADLGVYQSQDAGATWSPFASSLPNAYIGDLIFHPHARVLRAATRNRGVWEIPVDGWPTSPTCGVQWTGTLAPHASGRWFTFNWPAAWHVIWTAMPTVITPGGPQLSYSTQVERASSEFATYWITVRNLSNAPVTFEGRFEILSLY